MTNEDIVESVISLLAVDGSFNKWEKRFFTDICQRLEISPDVKKRLLARAKQGKGRVHLPEDEGDRNRLLYFLTQAVVADGKVVEQERKILYAFVEKIGISKEYVDNFIASRLGEIKTERYSAPPADRTIKCPKCGYEQPAGYKCKRCGIIFEKYKEVKGPSDEDKLFDLLSSSNKIG